MNLLDILDDTHYAKPSNPTSAHTASTTVGVEVTDLMKTCLNQSSITNITQVGEQE